MKAPRTPERGDRDVRGWQWCHHHLRRRERAGTERREGRAALGRSQVMDPNRIVSNVSQGASEKMSKEQRQTVNLVLHLCLHNVYSNYSIILLPLLQGSACKRKTHNLALLDANGILTIKSDICSLSPDSLKCSLHNSRVGEWVQ